MKVKVISDIKHCKCGNLPTIGGKFWYNSKYGANIEGVILSIEGCNITSTTGVSYPVWQIEVKPLQIIRDEKLTELGI